ncbi:MAG: YlxR family protein [Mogibacterium sp.]|nr:YlxR family protein [Mogibacterium sp.]
MAERKTPMRRCIGCMQSFPQQTLIRMTLSEDVLSIDRTGRARGRGCYLCKNAECIEKARKNKAFNRNYKRNINQDMIGRVLDEALLLIKEVANDEKNI